MKKQAFFRFLCYNKKQNNQSIFHFLIFDWQLKMERTNDTLIFLNSKFPFMHKAAQVSQRSVFRFFDFKKKNGIQLVSGFWFTDFKTKNSKGFVFSFFISKPKLVSHNIHGPTGIHF